MEKRVLPPRVNRGRRPQPSQQQNARDDEIYDQIFQRAMKQASKSPTQKQKSQQKLDNTQNQFQHRQFHSNNRICYPYSRGYHYFFDLNSFPRAEGSISYAVDEQNIFGTTYSQENKIIKDNLTVGQLVNRKLFGLPICSPCNIGLKTKDKNICHSYLFINQDRKFNIDRSLYELKQINKRFDTLLQKGEINKFSCIKKDLDLISILEDQLSFEDKKAILCKRIKILEEKKENMKNYVMLQDKYFFHHSLNQRLHDQIQQKTNQLTYEYILGYLYVYDILRQKIKNSVVENERKIELKKLLSYCQYERPCVSQQLIDQINKKITMSRFCEKEENSPIYLISAPFVIFDFSNINLMSVCEKILALKCFHQSQALFYMCKMFWKRIFNKDLMLNKQSKPLMRPEYDKAMNLTISQLQRWKKQQQKKGEQKGSESKKFPTVDPILDLSVFEPESKSFDLFCMKNEIQIGLRQYITIVLFYQLYLSLEQISEFCINNGVLTELIAGDFFNRGNNFITEIMGSARVGIIQEILRRITENIIKQEIQNPIMKLKWVYNENLGVAYVIKSSPQSDWETEKQQSHEDQQQKVDQKDDEQQVLDLGPQKRVFR